MAANEIPAWYQSATEFASERISDGVVTSGTAARQSAGAGYVPAASPVKCRPEEPAVFRQIVESLACLAVAVIVFRAFLLEGYIISTGSMAPSLLGYHKQVVCPDCQFEFAFGVAFDRPGVSLSQLATCPNCGQGAIDVSNVPRNDGDQLLVNKHAYLFDDPDRWEVVVFLNPNNPNQAYVKRVVGLPGETIHVRDGDVYIDGKIQRKTLTEQKALRIPVFDQNYQATQSDWIPRWLTDSGWTGRDSGFTFHEQPAQSPQGEPEWIDASSRLMTDSSDTAWVQYFHWPRLRHRSTSGDSQSAATVRPAVITDDYGYNQPARVSEKYPVTDLMLSTRVKFGSDDGNGPSVSDINATPAECGSGEFVARIRCRDKQAVCRIDAGTHVLDLWIVRAAAGEADRVLNGEVAADVTVPLNPEWFLSDLTLELSTFDQQTLVAVNGVELAIVPLDSDLRDVPDGSWSERPVGDLSKITVAGYSADSSLRAAENAGSAGHRAGTTGNREIRQTTWTGGGRPDKSDPSGRRHIEESFSRPGMSPVAFGARHGRVSVQSVTLYRDVHYTTENHRHATERPLTLGEDEFFFLGDNSPVSLDSRGWADPVVPRRLLVGRPLVVHLPSHPGRVRIGSTVKYIRLPDFSKIRCIR